MTGKYGCLFNVLLYNICLIVLQQSDCWLYLTINFAVIYMYMFFNLLKHVRTYIFQIKNIELEGKLTTAKNELTEAKKQNEKVNLLHNNFCVCA